MRAVEDVLVFEEVGLVGEDLLGAQRPLLVPWTRQTQRLVPGGKLHGPRAGVFRERHAQHLDEDAVDVVLRLLLGEAQRIHLHAVAEEAQFRILHPVALAADLVPQSHEGAHLADLGDEADAGIDEEADPAEDLRELLLGDLTRGAHRIEDADGVRQRKGELLHRRGPGLLQVVAADVDRVPLRDLAGAEGDHVGGELHRRAGREDVGAAREVLLDDVVLHRALQLRAVRPLLLGHRQIEREDPRGGGVDGHGGVHALEGDPLEQPAHVVDGAHRHAHLAHLAARQRMVAVVAGLGGQVEGDREARLAAGEVAAEQLVAGLGRAVAGVGAEQPGAVAARLVGVHGGTRRRIVPRRTNTSAAPRQTHFLVDNTPGVVPRVGRPTPEQRT
ncbi:hypothetical protein HRbin39_01188 [bacterium HR39]|nr:hypothetical protein HRbin39_01188 [bacterium HR39]